MAATANTNTDAINALLGDLKETYAKAMENNRVEDTTLQTKFPVQPGSEPVGNKFHVPMLVSHSQSTTYDVSQGTRTLNPIVAPNSIDAQIPAVELSERMLIPFGMMKQSGMGKNVAFLTDQVLKMIALDEALRRQVEFSLLYGGSYVAQISAVSNSSGTNQLTFTSGSFAPGYLANCENQKFDAYSSATGASGQRNTNAALVCTVVDPIAGTMTVTGNSTDTAAIAANDYLFRYNEVGFTMTGLATQLSNTSATLFTNMVPGNYNIVKGNVQGSVGNLSMSRIVKYLAIPKNKGLKGDATGLVSPDGFSALANDLITNRRYDGSYQKGKLETGAETLKVKVGAVTIEFVEHSFLRSAEVYIFKDDTIMRPGVSDIVDNIEGLDLAVMSSTTNGYEFRKWTSQAIFCSAPSKGLVLTGCTFPG